MDEKTQISSANVDIEKKHWFNNKQVIALVFIAVMCTATVVKVHDEFEFREARYQNEKALMKAEINVLADRLDKKIKIINLNTEDINKLKQTGSDAE